MTLYTFDPANIYHEETTFNNFIMYHYYNTPRLIASLITQPSPK